MDTNYVTLFNPIGQDNPDLSNANKLSKWTLIASDSKQFPLCQTLLEKQSDYFQALIHSGMKETLERTVHFPTLSSKSILFVQDFMQNGKITLKRKDYNTLNDVIAGATYLQIQHLIAECNRILKDWHDLDSILMTKDIMEQFDLSDVASFLHEWCLHNGSQCIETGYFKGLPFNEAYEILSSDGLNVANEVEVLIAVNRWLNEHHETSPEEIESLYGTIRFSFMDEEGLNTVSKVCSSEDNIPKSVKDKLSKAKSIIDSEHRYFTPKEKMRCSEECLVALGGFSASQKSSTRFQLIPTKDLNTCSSRLSVNLRGKYREKLPTALCEHCACEFENDIYIAGGQESYTQNGAWTNNRFYRFNTNLRRWSKLKDMISPRSLFYLAPIGNLIYAISGWIEPNSVTRTSEAYDRYSDTWKSVANLPIGVHEHAGCVYQDKIYISGGYKGPERGHLDRAWCFTPQNSLHPSGHWIEMQPMNKCRSYHIMVPVKDQLLVVGGVQYHQQSDTMEDIKQCEIYDIALDQWSIVWDVPNVGSCMGHVTLNNKLLLFGGHTFADDAPESTHRKLQVLDLDTLEWAVTEYTANKVHFFPCIIIDLPSSYVSAFKLLEKAHVTS